MFPVKSLTINTCYRVTGFFKNMFQYIIRNSAGVLQAVAWHLPDERGAGRHCSVRLTVTFEPTLVLWILTGRENQKPARPIQGSLLNSTAFPSECSNKFKIIFKPFRTRFLRPEAPELQTGLGASQFLGSAVGATSL